eukprot:scaffold2317_cov160-Pinguiococcus_pyrenoidosus.AAC.2
MLPAPFGASTASLLSLSPSLTPSLTTLSKASVPEVELRTNTDSVWFLAQAATYTCLPSGLQTALLAPSRPFTTLPLFRSPSRRTLSKASAPEAEFRRKTSIEAFLVVALVSILDRAQEREHPGSGVAGKERNGIFTTRIGHHVDVPPVRSDSEAPGAIQAIHSPVPVAVAISDHPDE